MKVLNQKRIDDWGKSVDNHKDLSKGCFEAAEDFQKQFVMECVSHFHYRDVKHHSDGSVGTIEITPGELNDILAYAIKVR